MNKTVLRSDAPREGAMEPVAKPGDGVIEEICNLNWRGLSLDDLIDVAWSYYYFSVQFRENLEVARQLFPDDDHLHELDRGERVSLVLRGYEARRRHPEQRHHWQPGRLRRGSKRC